MDAPHILTEPAGTAGARAEVFRFRHERGVRPSETLLPSARLSAVGLVDELDPLAVLITARDAASRLLVGAARINLGHEGLGPYPALYGLTGIEPAEWRATSVTSGWVVAWDVRDARVPAALACEAFRVLVREQIMYDYLDCSDGERGFFESLGYRPIRRVRHPTRGETWLMRLSVIDRAYLREINSPLVDMPSSARVEWR